MEEPESEWQIQVYDPHSKEHDEGGNITRWILKTGYGIGKKIAITGIVVSSAPLVVPPLVVFSAIGVAFSVPFGLLFASYACTNKLMSMLLPTQPPPLMLEYHAHECEPDFVEDDYITYKEDNEQMQDINPEIIFESDDDYTANVTNEKEREQMEDVIKQGVEMRPSFELDGDDEGYEEDDESLEEEWKGEERLVEDENGSRREEVNEDAKLRDEGNSMVEDDCESASNVETTKPVTVKEVEFEDRNDVNQGLVDKDIVDEREVEMGTEDDTVQIENVREEKEREQMEDVKQGVETGQGFDISGEDSRVFLEGEDDDSVEEERKGKEPLADENKSHREEVNEDAKLRDEGRVRSMVEDDCVVGESTSDVVFGDVKDVAVTIKEIESHKLVEVGSKNDEPVGANSFNSRQVEELEPVSREVIGDANKDERNIESDEKVGMGTQKKTGGEDVIMEEHLIQSNADSKEIGCLDLESLKVGSEVKENAADENVDVLAPNMDDAKVAYKNMPSREGKLDDAKIWEKIGAMRTIVGYKAPSQPTFIKELKALYVFTGVEPPASFEGECDSDLDEVNAKLEFLMAIVGVK